MAAERSEMSRLITFHQFLKLIEKECPDPRHARRIWNTITFELMQLGGAFPVSDDERVAKRKALKEFLSPTRRLKNLTRIGKKSEQALRAIRDRL